MSVPTRWIGPLLLAAALTAGLGARLSAQAEDGLRVGSPAPRVAVTDLAGRAVDLRRLIGVKPVFLEFWATWCEVCAALMPTFEAAHAALGGAFEFLVVNVAVNQTRDRVRRYVADRKPPFMALYDEEATSTRAYHVPTTSYVVIIDRAGRVVYTGSGASQDFEPALRKVSASAPLPPRR